ncbi:MAG: RlmE family RNA methyltransferase [Deltaproteobacteria bacterium]|nr:RlmE family RNA methyltransferase [Deltaproteobacteria bacterium]MBI3293781.1 RlmE family RNA methyltransferase [Deltaproteobacteria bacterium]
MRKWNDDPFTKKARKENYEARSVYKLQEIQKRDRVLDNARAILDLGAAPGSWSQFCLEIAPKANVFAIDLSPIHISNPRLKFLEGDIEQVDMAQLIAPVTQVDVVLSDMAPKTTGIASVDVARSTELVALALRVADHLLAPKGNMVAKLFMGESLKTVEAAFIARFDTTRLFRPESTRKQSKEIFLIGKSRRA